MSLDLVNQQLELDNKINPNANEQGEMPNPEGADNQESNSDQNNPDNNSQEGEMPDGSNGVGDQNNNPDSNQNPDQEQNNTSEQSKVFDWSELEQRTGGVVKDEETLTQIVQRQTEYENLSNKVKELESNQFKPANDFVAKLNSLVADGAKPEQITAFINLNQIGDFSTMDSREILVHQEMLLNGASKEVAEFRVDSKFDFVGLDTDSIEYKALMHEQSLASKDAIGKLNEYKTGISQVVNEEKTKAEEARLKEVHLDTQRMSFVQQEAPKIAQNYQGKVEIDLGDGKKFEHNFSNDFKQKVNDLTVEFFEKTKLPLNEDSLSKLGDFLEVKYIAENKDKIYKDMHNQISSRLSEEFANRYENRSGLPSESANPNPASTPQPKSLKDVQDDAAKKMGFR